MIKFWLDDFDYIKRLGCVEPFGYLFNVRGESANYLINKYELDYDYDKNSRTWKPIMRKYGASTTWMGKLLYRLESRRNGGCPVLAIGIKKTCVSDWKEGYIDEHASGNI